MPPPPLQKMVVIIIADNRCWAHECEQERIILRIWKETKENIAEKVKNAYNIAIAILAVAICLLHFGRIVSAQEYDKSNCSAGHICAGSDYIQFYDKSDKRGFDNGDVGGNAAGSHII